MTTDDYMGELLDFLTNTLSREKLSKRAENQRKVIVDRIGPSNYAYLEMKLPQKNSPEHELEVYEVLTPPHCHDSSEQKMEQPNCLTKTNDGFGTALRKIILTSSSDLDTNSTTKQNRLHSKLMEPDHVSICKPQERKSGNDIPTKVVNSKSDVPKHELEEYEPVLSDELDSSKQQEQLNSLESRVPFDKTLVATNTYFDVSSRDLSAAAIKQCALHSGFLFLAKRRLFFPPSMCKYWAALLNQHIFFYKSDLDKKSLFSMPVQGYQARQMLKPSSKMYDFFELVRPGYTTHKIAAKKGNEMDTWLTIINKLHESYENVETNQTLPSESRLQLTDQKIELNLQVNRLLPSLPIQYDVPKNSSQLAKISSYEKMKRGLNTSTMTKTPDRKGNKVYTNCRTDDESYYNLMDSPEKVLEDGIYQTIQEAKELEVVQFYESIDE